ncbi:MAG: hypothetical protein WHX52_22920, partial [Anaerolineae bacterium]
LVASPSRRADGHARTGVDLVAYTLPRLPSTVARRFALCLPLPPHRHAACARRTHRPGGGVSDARRTDRNAGCAADVNTVTNTYSNFYTYPNTYSCLIKWTR